MVDCFSVLAGAMTAASLALADAGVEMYDLVVGASMVGGTALQCNAKTIGRWGSTSLRHPNLEFD